MKVYLPLLLVAAIVGSAHGHGAMTNPPPRNAIDSDLLPWGGEIPRAHVPFIPWCPFPSASAVDSDPTGRNLTGANGQACFWFSNGCAIGCDACDGSTRGPIPMFSGSPLRPVPGHVDIGTHKPVQKEPICGAKALPATVCDPKQRTVNTGAACGSKDDFYYYSPWRRPGSAPVIDACGTAGGRFPGQGRGGFGAVYQNTTHAKEGDLGTALPHIPGSTVWDAGSTVEVAWALRANHGGGYSYRLCPLKEFAANASDAEACFQRHPLKFVGQSAFRWGGVEGHTTKFDATYVTEGTSPANSMWAMNPVPRAWRNPDGSWNDGSNHLQTGEGFTPFCKYDWRYPCTGEGGPNGMEIVDQVEIPASLPAGSYVLGWRWDCEESNQIWSSCSDISIVHK